MAKCIKCGVELPDGATFCEGCGTNQCSANNDFPSIPVSNEIEILQRIEEGQQKNLKLLKSISSSTAILAAVAIIQIILTLMIALK